MRAPALTFMGLFLAACPTSTGETTQAIAHAPWLGSPMEDAHSSPTAVARRGIAYFAGGCFWGVEHYLEQLGGVHEVVSGYMGGHVDSPSYNDVSNWDSGHLETVRVSFDPSRVSYVTVARRFFEIHDPTQVGHQGPDIGPQYQSAVFYVNEEQRHTARRLIERLVERGYAVVTTVRPAQQFWSAEDHHQDYYEKSNKTPYCHTQVNRFTGG